MKETKKEPDGVTSKPWLLCQRVFSSSLPSLFNATSKHPLFKQTLEGPNRRGRRGWDNWSKSKRKRKGKSNVYERLWCCWEWRNWTTKRKLTMLPFPGGPESEKKWLSLTVKDLEAGREKEPADGVTSTPGSFPDAFFASSLFLKAPSITSGHR